MTEPLLLPDYFLVESALDTLNIPISASELHGLLCGYLAAGAVEHADNYLRTLCRTQQSVEQKNASVLLFETYTISQYQLTQFGFEIQLLLPDEHMHIQGRAIAFREWCEGFTQGITISGLSLHDLHDEEAEEAMEHLTAFGELDETTLSINDEDEKSLFEVTEYARLAMLSIYTDVHLKKSKKKINATH